MKVVTYDPNDIYIKNRVINVSEIYFESSNEFMSIKINNNNFPTSTSYWDFLFWKVVDINTEAEPSVQMVSDLEKEHVINIYSNINITNNLIYIRDYSNGVHLSNESWYYKDNGDGTYSGKVKEIIYNYDEDKKNKLLSMTTKLYYLDGEEYYSDTQQYYCNNNSIILKRS